MNRIIVKIVLWCCLILMNSSYGVFLGVENKSSKAVSVSCRFLIGAINGSRRSVEGSVKVGGNKFGKWTHDEKSEEEKKGDAFLVSFGMDNKHYDLEEKKGRFWFLTIREDRSSELVKYLDSYQEEDDKEKEKEEQMLKEHFVAQRVRAFTNGSAANSSASKPPSRAQYQKDPKKLTRFYTDNLPKIIDDMK